MIPGSLVAAGIIIAVMITIVILALKKRHPHVNDAAWANINAKKPPER